MKKIGIGWSTTWAVHYGVIVFPASEAAVETWNGWKFTWSRLLCAACKRPFWRRGSCAHLTQWLHKHRLWPTSTADRGHRLTRLVNVPLSNIHRGSCSSANNSINTRAVQPVATCRQSPYLHKPAIVVVTSFSLWRLAPTALAAPVLIMTSFSFCDVIRYWAGHIHHYGRTYGHLTAFDI